MNKLATEFQGFLKFIARADKNIINWFGSYCNFDPVKITFMAAREWDGMAEDERKFFVKAQILASREGEKRAPTGKSPFLCFLLHKRYTNFPSISKNNRSLDGSTIHPQYVRLYSDVWWALPKSKRDEYACIKLYEMGLDHVIKKRDKLHQIYGPNELTTLEFILKTKPKKPLNSRAWFLVLESLSINSTKTSEKWRTISREERRYYEECARLDRKRYKFEKNAWMTKLLSANLDSTRLTLADFESQRVKLDVTTLSSMIELNKELLPTKDISKRPMSAFSMFVRDHSYQTKDQVTVFKFGQHLRDSSKAWANLPEETKQEYIETSRQLRESYKKSQTTSTDDNTENNLYPYELSRTLFKNVKSVNGPSRPSHLLMRAPSITDLYGRENNIKRKDRKQAWESLKEEEKEPYYRKHESVKNSTEEGKRKISEKLAQVRELIIKAEGLEKMKRDLYLIRSRN